MLNLLISADHYHKDTYDQDVLPRPRVYTDHHGDTYGHDVLPRPRVCTDHHGGKWSRCIAEAKGIYISSWRNVGSRRIAKA